MSNESQLGLSFLWILREINFGESRSAQTALFAIFGKFQPSKSAKIHKNQNSEPLNVSKWQTLNF